MANTQKYTYDLEAINKELSKKDGNGFKAVQAVANELGIRKQSLYDYLNKYCDYEYGTPGRYVPKDKGIKI